METKEALNPLRFRSTNEYDGLLEIIIQPGDSLRVDSSKMLILDSNVYLKLRLKGAVAGRAKGTFLDVYECKAQSHGRILLGPAYKGPIGHRLLKSESMYIVHRYLLACSGGIAINTQRRGVYKDFYKTSKLIILKCYGVGDVWWNSFGSFLRVRVKGVKLTRLSQLVAFSEGLKLKVLEKEGLYSCHQGGDQHLCEFTGEGSVWVQAVSGHHQECWT